MGSRIRLDGVCGIELVRTHIYLAVLHTFRKRHIIIRQLSRLHALINEGVADLCIFFALMNQCRIELAGEFLSTMVDANGFVVYIKILAQTEVVQRSGTTGYIVA